MIKRALIVSALVVVVAAAGIWAFTSLPVVAELKDAKPGTSTAATGAATASKGAAAITGFRSAKFGEDEQKVRVAINTDFGKSEKDIKVSENPGTRTKALMVTTNDLVPDTGAAEVGYVFGYKSKTLVQVNILWGTPVSPTIDGKEIARTAVALKNYFSRQGYDRTKIIRDRRIPGGVLVFQAVDANGHMLRLTYREVVIPARKPVKEGDKPTEAKKSYLLNLTYAAEPNAPDVFKIEKGAF